ncbi:PD-(D/E)XK nuclease family protein [bacterium]|nr:PD-(D/E)XK nuclease family protein [bacterium]
MSKSILTYSSIKLFQSCRWKYNQRYNNNLTPFKEKDVLYLGSVWHSVLEIWYGPGDYDSQIEKAIALIDKSFPDYLTDAKQKQNWHLCHAMFQGYINRYPEEDFKPLGLEMEFVIPIINPLTGRSSRTFELRGKVDGLVQLTQSGELFLLEHKTAAQVSTDYIERLPFDFQINLYAMALSRFLKLKISGVIYNVIRKAKLKQSEGETEEQYEIRKAELIRKSKSGKTSAKRKMPESDEIYRKRLIDKYNDTEMYYREVLYLSDQDAVRTSSELWDIAKLIRIAKRDNNWIPNWDNCFQFGNQPCTYWPLCRSNNNPLVLENYYTVKEPHTELSKEAKSIF